MELAGAGGRVPGDVLRAGGPVSVYGYFVTNNAGTVLLWAERFTDGPYNLPSGGGSIKITPSIEAS